MKVTLFAAAAASLLTFPPVMAVAAADDVSPAYHVTKTVLPGAPDRWDYVVFDSSSHRVFVSHGDRVTVADGRDGTILGNVEGMPGGTHGIGISAANGRGYTDDGRAGVAVSFDLATLKTIKQIKADNDADGIVFDPTSGHIFVVDGDPANLTVIDPKTDIAIATFDTGGKIEYAVAGNNGKLYANVEANKETVCVDTTTNKADAHWPMPGCTSPHGLAIDRETHRLFSSCANKVLTIVNADSGAGIATLPIGTGTDSAAFDPKRKLAFSSNGDGTLSIIREKDAQTFVSLGSIKTAVTGKTMSIGPDTGRLYIAAADVDPGATTPANGRVQPLPGTLKLLFLDPGP